MSRHSRYVPATVEIEMDGFSPMFMGSLGGSDLVARKIWWYGYAGFEKPLPQLYASAVKTGKVFLGVGANSGFYELITAAVNDSNHIYAFEPFPDAINALKANISLNGLEQRINVVEKAVSNRVGEQKLYVPSKQYGEVLESSASLEEGFREQHSAVFSVPTVTLDAFVAEEDLEGVDLLRIDVEGAEDLVIEGSQQIIATHRPLIFIEILKRAKVEKLQNIFQSKSYDFYWFDEEARLVKSDVLEYRESNHNQIICPSEKEDQLKAIAHDAGVEMRV